MDETPSPVSSRNELQRKSHRYTVEEDDGDGNSVKCTGKGCKSYTAGMIADCVAICCCPCAVVNILTFTFLKIPYIMGRKWLRKMKMRNNLKRKRRQKRKCESANSNEVVMEGRDGNSRKRRLDHHHHEGAMSENDIVLEFGVEELKGNCSTARLEDNIEEDVWLELYKIGHLGFGRVSFSG